MYLIADEDSFYVETIFFSFQLCLWQCIYYIYFGKMFNYIFSQYSFIFLIIMDGTAVQLFSLDLLASIEILVCCMTGRRTIMVIFIETTHLLWYRI